MLKFGPFLWTKQVRKSSMWPLQGVHGFWREGGTFQCEKKPL